jgi:hypothetical protein
MVEVSLIQSSQSALTGSVITSFEWEYPRFIHAEVLTHRVLSKNAGSSRAVPVVSMIELARDKMIVPEFKYNQSGMQPAGLLAPDDMDKAKSIWRNCAGVCIEAVQELNALKVHKQWANRMLEWFSPIKIVATATDWDNFLWLRNDFEAQDEIEILASMVELQLSKVEPFFVPLGHAHVPYVDRVRDDEGGVIYSVDGEIITRPQALIVSSSVCAQMSYRKADKTLVKAKDLYGKFMEGRRIHASPFEHQALVTDQGYTHTTKNGDDYSANLRGWTQFRHLIEGNTCTDLGMARMLEVVRGA